MGTAQRGAIRAAPVRLGACGKSMPHRPRIHSSIGRDMYASAGLGALEGRESWSSVGARKSTYRGRLLMKAVAAIALCIALSIICAPLAHPGGQPKEDSA